MCVFQILDGNKNDQSYIKMLGLKK